MGEKGDITRLLQAASTGDDKANDVLFSTVYEQLRTIAKSHRRRWTGNETLNTTALIHEAYVKLAPGALADYENRTHFFGTASKAMRQILINYAERVAAAKRGGDMVKVTLSDSIPFKQETLDDLMIINEMLAKLETDSARQCRIFECRVFGGMTIEETASALGVSSATVKRDWRTASTWIYQQIRDQ